MGEMERRETTRPPIRAVFFDLDDTLCDAATAFAAGREAAFAAAVAALPTLTPAALMAAWRAAHADLMPCLEAGDLTMAAVRGARFHRTLALAGAPDSPATHALADRLDTLLGETQLAALRPFDDLGALAELRRRGVFVGVITNGADDAQPDSQRTKAARLGLLGEPAALDGFWVSDALGYRKPDPRAFVPALEAARLAVGAAPAACVYVGDSPANDVAGANAAGMRSVWLLRGDADPAQPGQGERPPAQRPWRVIRTLWQTLDLPGIERLSGSPLSHERGGRG